MRIIFIAVIIYAVYLLMRLAFRTLAFRTLASKQPKDSAKDSVITQARRKFDPREAEDADFEEIKKD